MLGQRSGEAGPRLPGAVRPTHKGCLGALWRVHSIGTQEHWVLALALHQGSWDLGQVTARPTLNLSFPICKEEELH